MSMEHKCGSISSGGQSARCSAFESKTRSRSSNATISSQRAADLSLRNRHVLTRIGPTPPHNIVSYAMGALACLHEPYDSHPLLPFLFSQNHLKKTRPYFILFTFSFTEYHTEWGHVMQDSYCCRIEPDCSLDHRR